MISASAGVYQRMSAAKWVTLLLRFARGKQDVGAERGLEMVLLRESVNVVGSFDYLLHFRLCRRTKLLSAAFPFLVEEWLRA
jgi:hypothetical protein